MSKTEVVNIFSIINLCDHDLVDVLCILLFVVWQMCYALCRLLFGKCVTHCVVCCLPPPSIYVINNHLQR